MRINFNDIINSKKNKTGICVATGPSLKPHLDDIINLKNSDEHVIISVNEFDTMFPNLKADYRVVANSHFTVLREMNRLNKNKKTKLIYADSVDLTPKALVDRVLEIDYLPYDQRHFNSKHCTWGNGVNGRHSCCDNIEEGRLTIQEELKKYCNVDFIYGSGDTVALHMLSVALLLGCNPIYLVGMDLDYSKGYADGVSKNHDSFIPYIDRIISDFNIINESSKNINVNVYSLCNESPINKVFEYKQSIK